MVKCTYICYRTAIITAKLYLIVAAILQVMTAKMITQHFEHIVYRPCFQFNGFLFCSNQLPEFSNSIFRFYFTYILLFNEQNSIQKLVDALNNKTR